MNPLPVWEVRKCEYGYIVEWSVPHLHDKPLPFTSKTPCTKFSKYIDDFYVNYHEGEYLRDILDEMQERFIDLYENKIQKAV